MMDEDTIVKTCADECGADCCSGNIFVGEKDTERLRNAGHEGFITAQESRRMRTTEDGQCVFLAEDNTCSIYDKRPVDCQLFPLGVNLVADKVEIVLVDCPLSNLMTEEQVSKLVTDAKSIIGAFTRADLYAYDELAFSGEYTVLESFAIEQLQLDDSNI